MTVRLGFRDLLSRDDAARTGFVFDDDRLAECFGELKTYGARCDVRRPTGRVRHDKMDGFRRKVLRSARSGKRERYDTEQGTGGGMK